MEKFNETNDDGTKSDCVILLQFLHFSFQIIKPILLRTQKPPDCIVKNFLSIEFQLTKCNI